MNYNDYLDILRLKDEVEDGIIDNTFAYYKIPASD